MNIIAAEFYWCWMLQALKIIFYASVGIIFQVAVHLSCYCERNISVTNFLEFGTNFKLDSGMSWFDFNCQRSKNKVTVTS